MSRLIYAIIRADGCWRIVCERRRIGHYETCEQAAAAALALAREASHHDVEVLVQDAVGELWPVARMDAVSIGDPPEASSETPPKASGQSVAS
jgi:hypothetical protein